MHAKPRSFLATLAAVFWSFIGLRRRADFEQDIEGGMSPYAVITAALVGVLLFVATLISIVAFVTR